MKCQYPDCKRIPAPGYARCDDHTRALLEPPRVEVRRMGVRPLPEITESELSELELRFAYGDR